MGNHCKIYFTSNENLSAIDENIESVFLNIKNIKDSQIYLNKNMDFDKNKEFEFPDGFLFFKYTLDFESDELEEKDCVVIINILLTYFWDKNFPAIASCDYENELINKGGYNNESVPFPPNLSKSSN
jgi:hypothetical protein